MKHLPTILLLLTTVSAVSFAKMPAPAPGWNCKNADLEVSCNDEKCKVSDDHTPMDVHVSQSEMSICAYTGCWTGTPSAVVRSGGFETFTGLSLPFSTNPDSPANISVTVNRTTRVAMVLVEGVFANPALCTSK